MFDVLAKFFSPRRAKVANPEAAYLITVDDKGITCRSPSGSTQTIAWADLTSVWLSMSEDYLGWDYWNLEGEAIGIIVSIPTRATGEAQLRKEFAARLPGIAWDSGLITSGQSGCLWKSSTS
jgi:hypothetical protein